MAWPGGDQAHASAFALFEQGIAASGRGGAFVAGADDPSALFYNPAALAGLRGTRVELAPSLILFDDTFAGSAPFPGYGVTSRSRRKAFPLPVLYASHALGATTTVGAGVNAPFGLETDWSDDPAFPGRFLSTRARLEQLDASAGAGVALSPAWRLGAAANLTLTRIVLQRALAAPPLGAGAPVEVGRIDIESPRRAGLAATAGIQGRPWRRLELGLTVRTGSTTRFDAPAQFTYGAFTTGDPHADSLLRASLPTDQRVSTELPFPMLVLGGAQLQVTPSLKAELDFNWSRWSAFDTLDLRFSRDSSRSVSLPQNFHDAAAVRAGLELRRGPWSWRAGAYYDGTPQPASTMGPLLSDTARLGLSAGFSHVWARAHLDAYGLLVVFHDRSTEQSSVDHFEGSYRPRALVLGLGLGWVL